MGRLLQNRKEAPYILEKNYMKYLTLILVFFLCFLFYAFNQKAPKVKPTESVIEQPTKYVPSPIQPQKVEHDVKG